MQLWVVTLTLQNVSVSVSCVPAVCSGCSVALSLMSSPAQGFLPVTLLSLGAGSMLPACPQEWGKFLTFVCWHCWSSGSGVLVTCNRTAKQCLWNLFSSGLGKKPVLDSRVLWVFSCCQSLSHPGISVRSWGAQAAGAVPVHMAAVGAAPARAPGHRWAGPSSKAALGIRVCCLWQMRSWFYCLAYRSMALETILAHESC